MRQVFEADKPPVVGVIPMKEGDKGLLFNRVKQASACTAVLYDGLFSGSGFPLICSAESLKSSGGESLTWLVVYL